MLDELGQAHGGLVWQPSSGHEKLESRDFVCYTRIAAPELNVNFSDFELECNWGQRCFGIFCSTVDDRGDLTGL